MSTWSSMAACSTSWMTRWPATSASSAPPPAMSSGARPRRLARRSSRSAKRSSSTACPSRSSACSSTTRASRTAKSACWRKSQAGQPQAGGVTRNRGWGGRRRRGSFVFYLKNATVYIPLNTVWMKFRSGASQFIMCSGGGSRTITGTTGDPRLSGLDVKIAERGPAAGGLAANPQRPHAHPQGHRGLQPS